MEFHSDTPIYLQVIMELKNRMITGELAPGEKLPASRELALMYTINPNTAARVYGEMESMGLTFTKRGIGTFVTGDRARIAQLKEEYTGEIMKDFICKMQKMGVRTEDIPGNLEEYLQSGKWKGKGHETGM